MTYSADIKKTPRHFLPTDFSITTWDAVKMYFDNLVNREINDLQALEQWLKDSSELEAAISEDACWRQIKMTCDTTDKALEDAFTYFCMHIQPQVQAYADVLNKKLIASPFTKELDQTLYHTYLRSVAKNIELFDEKNIPIQSELAIDQQKFGAITGAMMVTINNQEYTLQQAAKFLENEDRNIREDAYRKINERRLQDKENLNNLFNGLLQKRNVLATNANCENYIDFRFKELGRFDYTPQDCSNFHEGVKQYVIPIVDKIYAAKQKALGVATLRPWDLEAEPAGSLPLKPFTTGNDLLQKSMDCFAKLNPFFAACLQKMDELKHFDLESRKGKAPGGYNCPLAETGAPFIFMNAAGQMGDVTTMVHEGGHAVHSFLAHPLALSAFKEYPMEIAEVASMAMELFSMDHWEVFFANANDLQRAKLHQLERAITIFPWIATIDKFQFWLYQNPNHTNQEREENWLNILQEFSGTVLDYSGLESYRATSWQRQLHLYEVPFYYIEYGIAQLGAIGMYQQYKQNKEQALQNYCNALSLGGTKTLPELYTTAGLEFDFSPTKIKLLVDFIYAEMESITNEA
jgi:oligoendopeptidase F